MRTTFVAKMAAELIEKWHQVAMEEAVDKDAMLKMILQVMPRRNSIQRSGTYIGSNRSAKDKHCYCLKNRILILFNNF